MKPVTPTASRLIAVPVTIWSAARTIVKMPNSSATIAAPTRPPTKPIKTLCVACAARTAVIAAVSIIPSMPRLMMPLRWTTSSPSTARRSGVDATMASGSDCTRTSITAAEAPEEDEHEDHDGLAERGHARGDAGAALQLAGSGHERAEEERRGNGRERMQTGEQRHGDAGVAVAGREALEQPMCDAEELDAAGESGDGAGEGHGPHDLRVHANPGPRRRGRVVAGGAQAETARRAIQKKPRRDRSEQREENADVQRADLRQRHDRIRLRILPRALLQRAIHRVSEQMDRHEVQQDRRQ